VPDAPTPPTNLPTNLLAPELSTVTDEEVVIHAGAEVRRHVGLAPGTSYRFDGIDAHTLSRPPGALLTTLATVNDTHFGEIDCGVIEGMEVGPILRSDPGEPLYPETMNRAAIAEIGSLCDGRGPDAVVAKGDLTSHGTHEEYRLFLDSYGDAFGERLYHVRGNHDAYLGNTFAADAPREVNLPGLTLAILDTVIPTKTTGRLSADQRGWLDEVLARADRPVLVVGHHHPWDPGSARRSPTYFGINPDDSEALVEIAARRPRFLAYVAGHTHRNRVREFAAAPGVPWVEVACTKDYPGSWAEYRVYEGGVMQVHHRISSPPALAWTERTRALFGGLYPQYALGRIEDRCFVLRSRSS